MRLLIIGCEYAGKKTLAEAVSRWMIATTGRSLVRWHDHFVVPKLDGHLILRAEGDDTVIGKTGAELNSDEDEEQIMSLRPSVLEQFQRHNIWRHLHPDIYRDDDVLFINHYYADAVYAPLYYGYGEPGSFSDRRERARAWDRELLIQAPDMVLVLVKASAEAVRERMAAQPRDRGVLKQEDIQFVLDRFGEEFEASLIERKLVVDTSDSTVEQSLKLLLTEIEKL